MEWFNYYQCGVCRYKGVLPVNGGWTDKKYLCISCHHGMMVWTASRFVQR